MSDPRVSEQPLSDWLQARTIEIVREQRRTSQFRGGPTAGRSETVHHLVESTWWCTIVIAAVGTGGCTYDCCG